MKKAKYRNRRLETLHKTVEALRKVGALDKATMRDIEALCLTKVEALSGDFGAAPQRRRQAGQRLGTRRQPPCRAPS
jgi:putative transcriptional regulator